MIESSYKEGEIGLNRHLINTPHFPHSTHFCLPHCNLATKKKLFVGRKILGKGALDPNPPPKKVTPMPSAGNNSVILNLLSRYLRIQRSRK